MFAAGFVLEHEYADLSSLPGRLLFYAQLLGSVSLLTLLIWGLIGGVLWLLGRASKSQFYGLTGRLADAKDDEAWKPRTFWLLLVLSALGVVLSLAAMPLYYTELLEDPILWRQKHPDLARYAMTCYAVGCLFAILAVSWEFLLDLGKLSARRIWALSRFSMKEAIRRKTLWSFCVILAVFLFASWFMPLYRRPEDQWRTYVDLVFFVTTALLLITASVLACFSLPGDIRQQTIHTVVTKPVQRFEIVLGRILGFGILMTCVLLVVAHLSLLYVVRGISPEAQQISMRARVAVFGDLGFEELDNDGRWSPRPGGDNVGREWTYRQYIRGGSTHEAIWRFPNAASRLPATGRVPIEFRFDIFRTTKGAIDEYREGVNCVFKVVNPRRWDESRANEYRDAIDPETKLPLSDQARAERFGYFELTIPNVTDYRTFTIDFPASLLGDLGAGALEVRVGCRSHGQYLGMAKLDLYLLAGEGNFYLNFLKGTTGVWFLMVLMVTLGVVFSTYLNAMVSLMLTWLLLLCGMPKIRGFIEGLANTPDPVSNPGGGPMEAFVRLLRNQNLVERLEQTPSIRLLMSADEGIRLILRAFLGILPDIGQFNREIYVAEGFNIPGSELLMSVLMLLGYVYPFLLAGYYLINVREVAN